MLGSKGRNLLASGSTTPSENQEVCCAVSSTVRGVDQAVGKLTVWVDTKLCVTAAT